MSDKFWDNVRFELDNLYEVAVAFLVCASVTIVGIAGAGYFVFCLWFIFSTIYKAGAA